MLDAGVGQHPLEITLIDHEQAGDGHREQPHEQQQSRHVGVFSGGQADLIDPQNRQERATGDSAGEKGADHARHFPIHFRLPRVHGGQPHLGPVADQQQDERRMEPRLGQIRGVLQDVFKRQGGIKPRLQGRIGQKERAHQRQGDADGADHQIFPGGLDASLGSVEVDQRRRHERGGFNGHPHQPQVVRPHDDAHDSQKAEQARAEDAVGSFLPELQVAHRVERTKQKQGADDQEHQPARGVQDQPRGGHHQFGPRQDKPRHGRVGHGGQRQKPGPQTVGWHRQGDGGHQEREENHCKGHTIIP